MQRLVSLLGILAAIATVFALPPVPPAAAAPPGCFCGGYQYTPQDWAQADTCQGARDALRAEGYAQIVCETEYGTCSRELILTADCHWDTYTGKWQVDGYVRYRCWWCDPV